MVINLELSTQSTSQLMDKVKDLIELAYQLGLEEGLIHYLDIFTLFNIHLIFDLI
jgi:hypothetical protein